MNFIVRLLITAVSAYLLQMILSGVHIDDLWGAVVFALVLGLLNIILKPILQLLGLPLTIITLGLFSFVINAVVILIVDYFVDSMQVDGFWWALIFSVLLSIVTSALGSLVGKD